MIFYPKNSIIPLISTYPKKTHKRITIKLLFLFPIIFIFTGCSYHKLNAALNRTKEASYTAITDPLTWGSAIGATALYMTYDDDITQHYMDHNIFDSDIDETLRTINGVTMYSSAFFVKDDTTIDMTKRVLVDFTGSATARFTTTTLNTLIKKKTPSGGDDYAIGSHHALDPFANSALTRRNVRDMSIPTWGKYTINTISYLSATGSAFARVQEGGHSVADQLVSVSIGNFIGLFFYEVFIPDNKELKSIKANIDKNHFSITANWNF